MANLSHPSKRLIYLWAQADFNAIRGNMQSLCEDFFNKFSTLTPVDVLWDEFLSVCNMCMDSIPTKFTSSKCKHPWINNCIKRITRRKQRAYNQARCSNLATDWSRYYDLKRECQSECRTAFNRYVSNLVDPNKNIITKRLWSFIKNKRQDNVGVSTLKHEGRTYVDATEKANLLADYFSSVFANEDVSNIPTLSTNPIPSISSIRVHVDGVYQLLSNIQQHKASGPDNLPARFLREVAYEISPVLSVIFQASLDQGVLPSIWKTAKVVPIHKKGIKSDPCNYRPVSLTCICCKILEHIVYSSISDHLASFNILCDEQHGFRNKRSCETQLITTVNDFAKCLNQKGQCDVLLLDFSKAFDKVPHSRLYYKLQHYGIDGPVLLWVKSFLSCRSQYVVLEGKNSLSTKVLSGVPQGTVLAPLLFLLYINDLPACVNNKVKLYADDVLLYSFIESESDCMALQEDLDKLTEWADMWLMDFNPKKCEHLRITNKHSPVIYSYFLGNTVITEVIHTKYLGVTFDQKLSWSEHIQRISSKANQVNGFLRRNLHQCPVTVKSNCYKMMVRPIVEYASSVWAPHNLGNINQLEFIQRRAARFCCNDFSRYSSVTRMMSSLNLSTLEQRRNNAKLIIMYKALNGSLCVPTDDFVPNHRPSREGYFNQLQTMIDSYKFSFYPSVIRLWNSLPPL